MATELPYRIALVILIAVTMGIVLYYRRQAASSGEVISREAEGLGLAIALRTAGGLLWLATASYLIYPDGVCWAALVLPSWVRWSGLVGSTLCLVLFAWTLKCLGHNLTDTVMTRQTATLVTNGPYRWVRHPYYVATAGLMACVTLLTSNLLIGLTSLLVLVFLAIRTPREEAMLSARFGDAYRQYMAHTGRFLPRGPWPPLPTPHDPPGSRS